MGEDTFYIDLLFYHLRLHCYFVIELDGSDMAEQILRDPYNFDFLTLADDFKERELERGLLIHLRDLLLELGRGFAFVGSRVPLVVGEKIPSI